MNYGDTLKWAIQNNAVFRFVNRKERGEFYAANMDIPGEFALEMAITVLDKTVAAHYPLDGTKEPSKAIAEAMIGCVEWFVKQQSRAIGAGGLN